MGIETVAAIAISAAISAGAQYQQGVIQKKQAEQQKLAAEAQKRMQEIQDQRTAREAFRKQRIAQAQVANAAIASGTEGSSGAMGAEASLTTQANQQTSDFTGTVQGQAAVYGAAQRNAEYSQDLGTLRQIEGVAKGVEAGANYAIGPDKGAAFKDLFGGSSTGANIGSNNADLAKQWEGVG